MEKLNLKKKFMDFRELPADEKKQMAKTFFIDNALLILLLLAIIGIQIYQPKLLSL